MTKYHAIRSEVDGYSFASKKEAEYYQELKLRQHDHSPDGVRSFTLQPRFLLQDKFTHQLTNFPHRAIYYVADFRVEYNDGRVEIIDVKGVETDVFKIKAKLFDFRYPELILRIK